MEMAQEDLGDGVRRAVLVQHGDPSRVHRRLPHDVARSRLRGTRVHPHHSRLLLGRSHDTSFGVCTQDWTPKPAVDVIEAIIDENEAFLAGGGGIEL
jgi:hypothetical protein